MSVASPQRVIPIVLWPLFLMGLVSAMTILICVYWLTSRLDLVSNDGAISVTDAILEETVDRLRAASEDYAFWDLAYELVQDGDVDQIFTQIGSGAVESDLFDQIFILSPKFEILHEFDSDGSNFADFSSNSAVFHQFTALLSETDPSDYETVSGYADLKGSFAAITALWITPDYYDEITPGSLPAMVGVTYLDTTWIERLVLHSGQNGHGFTSTLAGIETSKTATPLIGTNGSPVGYLMWVSANVGTQLRQEILPLIFVVCLSIIAVSLGAARFFNSQHRSLQRLKIKASTDQLTGILNRAGLDQFARMEETVVNITEGRVALIYLDLNGFKKLNDQLGHQAGDTALQVLAKHLEKSVRKTDIVARVGGDEFVCLIHDDNPGQAASFVADRIQTYSSEPIDFLGITRTLVPSIGVAIAKAGDEWETLLSQADTAMYWAKRNRSFQAAYYSEKMERGVENWTAREAI